MEKDGFAVIPTRWEGRRTGEGQEGHYKTLS